MFCLLNFYLLPLCEDVRKIPPIGHCCWESAVVARVVRRCSYRAFFLLPGEPAKLPGKGRARGICRLKPRRVRHAKPRLMRELP